MGKRVVEFVQVRGAIACRVGVAGTSQDHSFEGYAIEGSPRDAMSAILAKSRENEFSGLRKSWGVSLSSLLKCGLSSVLRALGGRGPGIRRRIEVIETIGDRLL